MSSKLNENTTVYKSLSGWLLDLYLTFLTGNDNALENSTGYANWQLSKPGNMNMEIMTVPKWITDSYVMNSKNLPQWQWRKCLLEILISAGTSSQEMLGQRQRIRHGTEVWLTQYDSCTEMKKNKTEISYVGRKVELFSI